MEKYCLFLFVGLLSAVLATDPLVHPDPALAIDPPPKAPPTLCPRNICRMLCQRGFQMDRNGCPVCACLEDPCEEKECGPNEMCEIEDHCAPGLPCRSLKATCTRKPMCAMPMCSNRCPNGYQYNKYGCMSCDCKEEESNDPCAHHFCPRAHKCTSVRPQFCPDKCKEVATCIPEGHHKNFHPSPAPEPKISDQKEQKRDEVPEALFSPCLFHTELSKAMRIAALEQLTNHSMLGRIMRSMQMRVPTCNKDGSFIPVQCHIHEKSCWCVNDRGQPIPESRVNIRKIEDVPTCGVHRTKVIQGTFMLVHQLENVQPHLQRISELVHDRLAQLLRIEHGQIIITQVKPKGTAEKLLEVHFTLKRNDKNELSHVHVSLAWLFSKKHGVMDYMKGKLIPQEDSLKMEHETEVTENYEGELPEHGLWQRKEQNEFARFYQKHKILFIIGTTMGLVFLVAVIAVIVTICKRGAVTSNQFKHKRLTEKSINYKKNLAFANWMEGNKKEKVLDEQDGGDENGSEA